MAQGILAQSGYQLPHELNEWRSCVIMCGQLRLVNPRFNHNSLHHLLHTSAAVMSTILTDKLLLHAKKINYTYITRYLIYTQNEFVNYPYGCPWTVFSDYKCS